MISEDTTQQVDYTPEPELPPRPRRRLLTPLPMTLIAALACACGFIGGVLIEKGETSTASGSTGGGLASRLGRLGGALAAAGGGGGQSGAGGLRSRQGGGAVAGEVTFKQGNTLYVLDANGNTVKVRTGPGVSVTKTVKGTVHGIHPGETVLITGNTGAGGVVSAESIRVGGTAGGALGALFGGSGSGSGGKSGAGGPALFGSGG